MSKFSTGRDIDGCCTVNNAETGWLIATLPRDMENAEYYAKLFAASPTLLTALRNLCIVFEDVCTRTGYMPGEYYSYRVAIEAIEEAEGITKSFVSF